MAATKTTLAALWGKKLQDERKAKSSEHGSVISTRSRAEDRNAQEKEATSRLSKPEEQASGPVKLSTVPNKDNSDAKMHLEREEAPELEEQRKRKRGNEYKEQFKEIFTTTPNPSADQKASLAQQSDLTTQQVSRWFENRRKKARQAKAEQASTVAEAPAAQAPEPIVLDDEEHPKIIAEDQVQGEAEQPAGTSIVAAAPCVPEQQAGPSQNPAAATAAAPSVNREEQLEQIREEVRALESHVTSCPHPVVPLDKKCLEGSLNRAQVASYLVGCSLPLSEVTAELWGLYCGDGKQSSELTEVAVRNMVIDLAARRSFAAKDAGSDKVDALEDKTGSFLWQWELREQKTLPKAHRAAATQHKKQMHKVAARLTALAAACKALEGAGSGKCADAKVHKALAKLEKTEKPLLGAAAAAACAAPGPSQAAPAAEMSPPEKLAGPSPQAPDTAAAAEPADATPPSQGLEGTPAAGALTGADKEAADAEKAKESERKRELSIEKERARLEKQKAAEEKERARIEAAREKERLRLEKEAQKREKEAEKERQRAAKEAEKERQRAEKEAAKTGFESRNALSKSRNFMNRFFKTPAKASGEAEGRSSQQPKTPMSAQPLRRPFHDIFTPAPEHARLPVPKDMSEAFDEAMAAAKQRSEQELAEGMQHILHSWRTRPRHRRIRGLPPSWARMRSAEEHVAEFGRLENARLWRRKFLWFHGTQRPPYYGSWSRISATVKGRRPLARDAELDYDVMSDEEWEEEPEGENLSDDDMEEEEDELEDSCGDGFVVPNGYISEDEGVGSVQQDLDDLAAELEDDAMGVEMVAGGDAVQRDRLRLLNAALDRATRANRPIIITRLPLPPVASSQEHARPSHLTGDPALLSALQPLVLTTKIKIRMIPPPEAEDATGDGAADTGTDTAAVRGRGRPAAQDQDELTPDLVQFLLSHPELKAVAKVVQAFTEAHSERKVVKKWVHSKVKDIAEHRGGVWVIKQSAAGAAPAQATAAPQSADGQDLPASTPLQQRPSSADQQPPSSQPAAVLAEAPAAAVTPATEGPLDRFLRAGSGQQGGTHESPAAPPPAKRPASASARPAEVVVLDDEEDAANAPAPMDVDAPPAAAAPAPGDVDEIQGTADPFWRELRENVAANSLQVAQQLPRAFSADVPAEAVRGVPSFVVTAMVKGLASGQCSRLLQSCMLKAMLHIVRSLIATGDAASRLPTPTKVFKDERSAPVAVSLNEILACRSLLTALQTAMRAKQNRPPQLAQPAAQLLAVMLAVGTEGTGAAEALGEQGFTPPSAAAVEAAAELRAHVAQDRDWHSLLADLLGPGNDAAIVGCAAKALASIGNDTAAVLALVDEFRLSGGDTFGKVLLAVSALAAKSEDKVVMERCMKFLAQVVSQKDAKSAVNTAESARRDSHVIYRLVNTVSAHIPAEVADSAAVDSSCLLPALSIGAFVANYSRVRGLQDMQRLSGRIAAHEEVWQKLGAAEKAKELLELLNAPKPY